MSDDSDGLLYDPDYVVHPGATLQEVMDRRGMSATLMARACNLTNEQVVGILDGSQPINPQMAADLSVGTGISAGFWENLERQYRKGLLAGKKDMRDE